MKYFAKINSVVVYLIMVIVNIGGIALTGIMIADNVMTIYDIIEYRSHYELGVFEVIIGIPCAIVLILLEMGALLFLAVSFFMLSYLFYSGYFKKKYGNLTIMSILTIAEGVVVLALSIVGLGLAVNMQNITIENQVGEMILIILWIVVIINGVLAGLNLLAVKKYIKDVEEAEPCNFTMD